MRRMAGAAVLFTAVVMVVGPAPAADFEEVWPGLIERIERAYVQGDGPEMITVRTALDELLDSELTDDQRSITRYTAAYLNWRLFVIPDGCAGR